MAFARRLSIEQLRHAGVEIAASNFVIGRRALTYDFQKHDPGAPAPVSMPRHRIVQFYRMKRLEAIGDRAVARPARYPTQTSDITRPVVEVPMGIPDGGMTPASFADQESVDSSVFLPDVATPVEEAIDPPTRPKFRGNRR